jgi:uncharacterized protein YxeA
MQKIIIFIIALFAFTINTSFIKKPYLLVGNWVLKMEKKNQSFLRKNHQLDQWHFSSDECTTAIYLQNGKKEKRFGYAYNTFQNIDSTTNTYLLLKTTNKNPEIICFIINSLSKTTMQLHFDKEKSSKTVYFPNETLEFERIAGPPENME